MKDLTGEIINNRLILGKTDEKSGGHWKWNAQCLNCQKIFNIRETEMRKAVCRCSKKSKPIINMAGERYGKWLVTDQYEMGKDAHAYWWCICDCGNEDWVSRPNLISGGSTSCGCNTTMKWNNMMFDSRWEVYIAMIMNSLEIKYEREKDKLEVINYNLQEPKPAFYIPDFSLYDNNGEFSHWVEVKGSGPKTIKNEWKTIQACEKYPNIIVIRENDLNSILGTKYRNFNYTYSVYGLDAVQIKINNIISDINHENKIKNILLKY